MKKFFPAVIMLILALIVTACAHTIPDNKTETEITDVQTTATAETTAKLQTTESKIESGHTGDAPSSAKSTTKTNSTDKPLHNSPTTVKVETTTKKTIVTTKKTETTAAHSIKLPEYSPQPSAVGLFAEINKYRENNSLNKLTLDSELCKMAYVRAMEQNTLKGHDRPDGSKYYTILDDYNYDYSGCGENISFGKNVMVESAFDRWANSDAHNRNMLESRWTKAGIAMYRNADNSYNIVILFACQQATQQKLLKNKVEPSAETTVLGSKYFI